MKVVVIIIFIKSTFVFQVLLTLALGISLRKWDTCLLLISVRRVMHNRFALIMKNYESCKLRYTLLHITHLIY